MPKPAQVGGVGPSVIPLLPGELGGPLLDYHQYVALLLSALQAQVTSLAADLRVGNVAAAESECLTAHLTWLQIDQDDGAYGAFGDLGRQIDGTSAGLLDGAADPSFTGFHKIECDIWTRGDVGTAAHDADRLVSLVAALARRRLAVELPGTPVGLSTRVLRPHEILEERDPRERKLVGHLRADAVAARTGQRRGRRRA